ncbi:MAG: hypothetical protein F6K22_22350 [Okeania sp. SIO2F4]|uniref:hypothetical protein n=1 Tax=Okeania sp. SIO2F4 TaxID=2607790 RepID=UPI0014296725|nr:hypothetical protein [Okeania sp. SIO2F4]MDJ0519325.1 hypothetical protein [Trichodesmium sp. MO_231.B1]NES05319.1 hypothetical protein [Okeania sp. SIO2F4]
MVHTFILESGQWMIAGNWLERNGMLITVKGKTIVTWERTDWFSMETELIFPSQDREDITLQYKGRLDSDERRYTFLLQHSELGKVEGEGWLGIDSIIQRYWVLGNDRQRRSGFETLLHLDQYRYYSSSGVLIGPSLISAMEATIERERE